MATDSFLDIVPSMPETEVFRFPDDTQQGVVGYENLSSSPLSFVKGTPFQLTHDDRSVFDKRENGVKQNDGKWNSKSNLIRHVYAVVTFCEPQTVLLFLIFTLFIRFSQLLVSINKLLHSVSRRFRVFSAVHYHITRLYGI